MSCCGKSRMQVLGAHPGAAPNPTARATFQYNGGSTMVVISPITGRRYHFAGPGARVDADPRDRQYLTAIPRLRAMKS